MSFFVHPRLRAGSVEIGVVSACHVLLKNNSCFPWFLIVPEVEDGVEDLHQLEPERFDEVMALVRAVSQFTVDFFKPEKLNVACIGNMVRQMHIHVVGRSEIDAAWPGTVWASDAKELWAEEETERICKAARAVLSLRKD